MGKRGTGVRPPKPFRGPVSLQYAFAILKANVAIFHPLKTISEWTQKQGEARHRMHFHVRDRTNFTVKSVPFFSLPVSYLGVTPVESGTGRGVGTQNEGLQFSRVVIKTLDTQKSFSIFSLSAPCLRRPFNSRFSLSLSPYPQLNPLACSVTSSLPKQDPETCVCACVLCFLKALRTMQY